MTGTEVERLREHILHHEPDDGEPRICLTRHGDDLLTAVREEQSDTIAREVRANIPHDAHPDYAEGMRDAAALAEDS